MRKSRVTKGRSQNPVGVTPYAAITLLLHCASRFEMYHFSARVVLSSLIVSLAGTTVRCQYFEFLVLLVLLYVRVASLFHSAGCTRPILTRLWRCSGLPLRLRFLCGTP
jgi:hypothetical protein